MSLEQYMEIIVTKCFSTLHKVEKRRGTSRSKRDCQPSNNSTHMTSLTLTVTFPTQWPESMDKFSWSSDKPSPTNAVFIPLTDKKAVY
jgi:hypothetical protein